MKDPGAKDYLVELLGDIEEQVRIESIKSIEQIGYGEGVYYVIDVVAVDPSPEVRLAALEYCRKHGNRMTVDELEMIKKGKNRAKFEKVISIIPSVIADIKKKEGKSKNYR